MRRAQILRARPIPFLLLLSILSTTLSAHSIRQQFPQSPEPLPDLPTPSPTTIFPDDQNSTETNFDDSVQTSTPIPASNIDHDAGTTIEAAGKDSPLSRKAVIAIAAGGGVALLCLLTIVIFFSARRRIHHNDSYYQFTDPAADPSNPVAPVPTLPPPTASLYSNPGIIVGSRNNSDIPSNSSQPYKTPRFKAPHSHAPANQSSSSANSQRIYGHSQEGPTAPSASQFSRRESDATSTSDDTIVAPVYGAPNASSTNAAAAAPWFHAAKNQQRQQQHRL